MALLRETCLRVSHVRPSALSNATPVTLGASWLFWHLRSTFRFLSSIERVGTNTPVNSDGLSYRRRFRPETLNRLLMVFYSVPWDCLLSASCSR
jgi:hypothetical protein